MPRCGRSLTEPPGRPKVSKIAGDLRSVVSAGSETLAEREVVSAGSETLAEHEETLAGYGVCSVKRSFVAYLPVPSTSVITRSTWTCSNTSVCPPGQRTST